jgi:hypothetical protein
VDLRVGGEPGPTMSGFGAEGSQSRRPTSKHRRIFLSTLAREP